MPLGGGPHLNFAVVEDFERPAINVAVKTREGPPLARRHPVRGVREREGPAPFERIEDDPRSSKDIVVTGAWPRAQNR